MAIAKEYRLEIEEELIELCKEVLVLLHNYVIPKCQDDIKDKVICFTLTGDFYRYLAEVQTGAEKTATIDDGRMAYATAEDIALLDLDPTDPVRLRLVLNFSEFYYETMGDQEAAINLAGTELDKAMHLLSEDIASYNETTILMQRIADNLTLWMSGENAA